MRRTIAHRVEGLDVRAIAEATISIWRQMDSLLAPVIGTPGMDVIFSRALYLTSKRFPWLASVGEYGESAVLLESLKSRMEQQCADDSVAAGSELLVCFTELLSELIGADLTERLLAPVLTYPSLPPETEIEP